MAISFVALLLSGLSLFHPSLYPLSELFGGGETVRWLHPWIGLVLVVAFLGLFLRFFWQNLPEFTDFVWLARIRYVLRAKDEDYLPEVGKYNAGQKFVFWSQFVLVGRAVRDRRGPVGAGLGYFENLLGFKATIEQKRWAALIHASGGGAGDHHLDHPRIRGDLGAWYHRGHDAWHGDRRLGLAPPPQVAAQGSGQGRDRERGRLKAAMAIRSRSASSD